jgi:hypothetical protein
MKSGRNPLMALWQCSWTGKSDRQPLGELEGTTALCLPWKLNSFQAERPSSAEEAGHLGCACGMPSLILLAGFESYLYRP